MQGSLGVLPVLQGGERQGYSQAPSPVTPSTGLLRADWGCRRERRWETSATLNTHINCRMYLNFRNVKMCIIMCLSKGTVQYECHNKDTNYGKKHERKEHSRNKRKSLRGEVKFE